MLPECKTPIYYFSESFSVILEDKMITPFFFFLIFFFSDALKRWINSSVWFWVHLLMVILAGTVCPKRSSCQRMRDFILYLSLSHYLNQKEHFLFHFYHQTGAWFLVLLRQPQEWQTKHYSVKARLTNTIQEKILLKIALIRTHWDSFFTEWMLHYGCYTQNGVYWRITQSLKVN